MKALLCILLVLVSVFKIDVVYTGEPMWMLWGNPTHISYDPIAHIWVNDNPSQERIFIAMDSYSGTRQYTLPEHVPEEREVHITVNDFWRDTTPLTQMQAAMAGAIAAPRRRIHLINVEESINELRATHKESRTWPHLGLLSVGTVADTVGWEVCLHDELVEGYIDLEQVVVPGDVVGLSLVATGMTRGIELARQAKHLGASYVIAGNDAAIFRTNQVLRLPDRPIDAVFTTNSLTAVREFLCQVGSIDLEDMEIPGVAIVPSDVDLSNERSLLRAAKRMQAMLRRQNQFDPHDVFVVPKLSLYSERYWQQVWSNYRSVFGHKHANPTEVRNALALFAQGCTRTGTSEVCSYCTIAGVADIRMPTREYLRELLETYRSFGIDYVFNATDSAFEMRPVLRVLQDLGAYFPEGLMLYGRAWGLAHYPELIDEWLSLTGGRLLINIGMDSGDERMLSQGVVKTSKNTGSRLEENRLAVQHIAASGAHLHYSLIFGAPGETRESCERSLAFFEWTRSVLGAQLDQCETDIYWLNHGSPTSRVFRDYRYAQKLAALAGKDISRNVWEHCFHRHRDTLVVPWECEEAWYACFTSITVTEAQAYNAHVSRMMATHDGAAPGRPDMCRAAFKPS